MIFALGLLTLLVATNSGAARIKGGPRIIQEPSLLQDVSEPHIHVSKGGGGAALHHTAVVQDPVSLNPVVVEKVSSLGSGLGASSAQFSLDDAQISSFGPRRLYRGGQSLVPFGLSGSDYYSFPTSLLTAPRRVLRRKTVASDNLSGLHPIGFGGRKGSVIVDPTLSQFSIGDAQLKTNVFGGRSLYRTGLSPVPYGLSGLDYYSYPSQLLTQRRIIDDGLGRRIITSGPSFTAGDSQIRGVVDPIGQEKVTIVESAPAIAPAIIPQQLAVVDDGDFGQRRVVTTVTDPLGSQRQITTISNPAGGLRTLRGGQIILNGGPAVGLRRVKSRPVIAGLGAPIGGFGQRTPVVVAAPPAVIPAPIVARAPQIFAAAPRIVAAAPRIVAPAPVIAAPHRFVAPAPVIAAPHRFVAPAPRIVSHAPVIAAAPSPFVAAAPSPVLTPIVSAPIRRRVIARRPGEVFLSQAARPRVIPRRLTIAQPAAVPIAPVVVSQPSPVVPQVISQVKTADAGLFGRRIFGRRVPQMLYVDGGNRFPGIDLIGGSRIGDPRFNYLQLPISTSRFATLGRRVVSGKIGGPIIAGPAGLAAVGHTSPTKIVTQEEVIGPAGERQIVTTVSGSGPSKIGGPVVTGPLGLTAVGQPANVVTQEEVIGPAGERQVVTTVSNAGPSKIGGPVVAGPLGLTGVGQAPTNVVTQEEVIGPAGDRQVVTTVTNAGPSKIGGPVVAGPLGLTAVGHTSPAKVVTQEEVIGPAGERQVVTTVSDAGPSKIGRQVVAGPLGLTAVGQPTKVVTQEEVIGPAGDRQVVTTVSNAGPSKIGGPVVSGPFGLTAVGQAPAKVVTQEEVIGPAGERQVVTTVSNAGPSKIGGPVVAGPLGLTAVGHSAPTKVITQEEVVGPLGDTQVVTTVTKTEASPIVQQEVVDPLTGLRTPSVISQVSQDPIETALAQEALGDSAIISTGGSSLLNPFSQSIVEPVVKESIITDPFSGAVSKVTEVSQQPIVQESISPAIGGGFGYYPRMSFLSSYPYDVPAAPVLRSLLTRPVVQEQQELEQILV